MLVRMGGRPVDAHARRAASSPSEGKVRRRPHRLREVAHWRVLQRSAGDDIATTPIDESAVLSRLVQEPALGHACPRCGVGRGSICHWVSGDRLDTAKSDVHQERRLTFLADYIESCQAGVGAKPHQPSE